MVRIIIKIDTSNDAFAENKINEINRILSEQVIFSPDGEYVAEKLIDINGNGVGSYTITSDDF